jgi:hypothetical protein
MHAALVVQTSIVITTAPRVALTPPGEELRRCGVFGSSCRLFGARGAGPRIPSDSLADSEADRRSKPCVYGIHNVWAGMDRT